MTKGELVKMLASVSDETQIYITANDGDTFPSISKVAIEFSEDVVPFAPNVTIYLDGSV